MATISEGQIREAISNQAAADKAFRAALISNPKATIESALGTSLPDGLQVVVLEDSDTKTHVVIPPFNTELSEDQLQAVAGGIAPLLLAGGKFLAGHFAGKALDSALGGGGGGGGGINQSGSGNVSCIGKGGLVNSNMEVGGNVRG